jgi:hypothetical protein
VNNHNKANDKVGVEITINMGTLGRKIITKSGGMIYRTRDDHKSRCRQSSFTL